MCDDREVIGDAMSFRFRCATERRCDEFNLEKNERKNF